MELLLREPKKDFLAGEVKEFMCLAMLPPDLPVRFTGGGNWENWWVTVSFSGWLNKAKER